MKAILTYKENYQINYTYENEFEAEKFTTYLLPFKNKNIIKTYYTEIPTKRTNKETISIIEKNNNSRKYINSIHKHANKYQQIYIHHQSKRI